MFFNQSKGKPLRKSSIPRGLVGDTNMAAVTSRESTPQHHITTFPPIGRLGHPPYITTHSPWSLYSLKRWANVQGFDTRKKQPFSALLLRFMFCRFGNRFLLKQQRFWKNLKLWRSVPTFLFLYHDWPCSTRADETKSKYEYWSSRCPRSWPKQSGFANLAKRLARRIISWPLENADAVIFSC